ncbi:ABC transporter substrate-binding protein [Pseudonocardia eucalypti]|uniref:ABC transporter substrate-binding protein n=1 Tax=Pseudonocardia eucalypti TaxID=648755 RepID=A0ABP9PZ46_9PSEU|nr:alpha-1,4-digalacturonate transport system substrate-binding protein [Pseudonocardia eucalypti]
MRAHRRAWLAAACLLVLTACAPGPLEQPPVPPGPIDPASFRGQSLDYVYFTDGPDEAATRAQLARFERETGARVNLQIVPFGDLEQTLQGRINSGQPPGVARVNNWRPYADALVDLKGYFGAHYPDRFVEGTALASQTADGRMPAVPSDLSMNGPLVNVDAFARAGVPVPPVDKPWTWDELVAAATKVQRANRMESAIAIDKSGHRLSSVLSAYGTTMMGPDGRSGMDPEKAGRALDMLNRLARSGGLLSDFWLESGSRYKGANELFLAQRVPVYLSGNWQVGQLAKTAKFNWAAAPNACAERCGGFPGGKYLIVFSGAPNPALGAYFADWMNSAEAQRALDEQAFWLPTRKDLLAAGIRYPAREADMAVFLAEVNRTPRDTYLANGSPVFDVSAKLLVREFGRLLVGGQDVPDAVRNVQAGVAELLAKVGS